MNFGTAVAIFQNIYLSEATKEEKILAIKTVTEMETHNSITKQEILNALEWICNVVCEDKRDNGIFTDNPRNAPKS